MKELVEKACEIMPNADHVRLKMVVGHAPKLVEHRYQMKGYKRTELGQIMMDAQYGVYTEYVLEPVTSNAKVKWNA